MVTEDTRQRLAATYAGLNPILLNQQLEDNLKRLWDMVATGRSTSHTTERIAYGKTQS